MPLTSGAMSADHQRKIKRNLIALKRDIDAKDLVDHFMQEEIFDFADSDEINGFNPNTVENRNNCFFRLLFRSGDQAYHVFLEALRANQQDHLADLIENTELTNNNEAAAPGEPYAWFATVRQDVKERLLTEKDLSRLAQTLGENWEFMARELGLSDVEIQHCKMEHQTPVMKIYAALNKWRMRNYDRCTLENFFNVAKDSQSTFVDWAQMQRIVQGMS